MFGNRYDIKWVGRCQFDNSDKVWGWFVYNDPTAAPLPKARNRWEEEQQTKYCYVFWGPTGKTLQFKRHEHSRWQIDRLVTQKTERKYVSISVDELNRLWDNLYETLNNKFVFHLLANDI